ncbi:MAG: protein-S-isoprenylcysteine O-methyltransferase [Planctomycetota bacterium]
MLDHPWNIVFLVGFVVYASIRHVFEKRTRGEEKVVRRLDGLEKGLLAIVMLGSFLAPVLYLFTPLLGFADYSLPALAPWIGTAIMLTALWMFWRSHTDLGQNWSITLELRRDHTLINHGVYRRIRHPMYLSIFLWSICQALMLENWLAGWSALVTFAPLYLVRTPREDALMCEHFGEEYRDYMARTGRLIPRMRTKKSDTGDAQ